MKAIKAMNEQEVNTYMQQLLATEESNLVLVGMESEILKQFKSASTSVTQAQQRLQQITQEAKQLGIRIQRLNGQQEAFAQLLIVEEQKRRSTAALVPDVPPDTPDNADAPGKTAAISLSDFREKMGADRVQMVDGESGKVIADTSDEATEAPLEEKAIEPRTERPPVPRPTSTPERTTQ